MKPETPKLSEILHHTNDVGLHISFDAGRTWKTFPHECPDKPHYATIVGVSQEDLDKQVNDKLKAGWKLYGSPYALVTSVGMCQAMIHE